jgi:hypothetical protein
MAQHYCKAIARVLPEVQRLFAVLYVPDAHTLELLVDPQETCCRDTQHTGLMWHDANNRYQVMRDKAALLCFALLCSALQA